MSRKQNQRWMKLDNAAKIYPAAMSWFGWMSIFRLSVELDQKVNSEILHQALLRTIKRFPSMSVRLRKGLFWYYLDSIKNPPEVQEDVKNPCAKMDFKKRNGYMFRVRYYENRIAAEFFHVLTDGTGGMVFLKTLVAEYMEIKNGEKIPRGNGILDCKEEPTEEETEDSFLRHARKATLSVGDSKAWHIKGTKESAGYMNVITAIIPASQLHTKAKEHNATVTEYLLTHMLLALEELQRSKEKGKKLPIKINVPINLRKFYGSKTLRNFANYMNVGITPELGRYTFEETLTVVKHQLGLMGTEKIMNGRFSSNVSNEKNILLRLTPLVIKEPVMKLAFLINGDRISTTIFSNIGKIELPEEMARHIARFDFMLGVQSKNPVACACVTFGDTCCLNLTRSIKESEMERLFLTRLVKDGIHVKVESNQ